MTLKAIVKDLLRLIIAATFIFLLLTIASNNLLRADLASNYPLETVWHTSTPPSNVPIVGAWPLTSNAATDNLHYEYCPVIRAGDSAIYWLDTSSTPNAETLVVQRTHPLAWSYPPERSE